MLSWVSLRAMYTPLHYALSTIAPQPLPLAALHHYIAQNHNFLSSNHFHPLTTPTHPQAQALIHSQGHPQAQALIHSQGHPQAQALIHSQGHPQSHSHAHTQSHGLKTTASAPIPSSSITTSSTAAAATAAATERKQQAEKGERGEKAAAETEKGESKEEEEANMNRGIKRAFGGARLDWEAKRSRFEHQQKTNYRPLTNFQYQQMTRHMTEYYARHQQGDALFESKMKLRGALYAIVKGVFPYCGLYVVGSSMNGFGSSSSDMDLCLMLSNAKLDQRREATEILRVLHSALQRCSFLRHLQLIRATVPILKFTDHISKVECDLNINNPVGIRNTHLLNAYTKMDHRLAPLVMFVKHWASYHNINDAKESTVSSYSLSLMVIHFLQQVDPPVLPCLHKLYPQKFGLSVDVRELNLNETLPAYHSTNDMTIGQLFLLFLQYYVHTVNFHEQVISVRLGKLLPRRSTDLIEPASQWKFLLIEEPYSLGNTARSVHNEYKWQRIRSVFRSSHRLLATSGDIRSVVTDPL